MADNVIDSLSIQIDSDIKGASKGIEELKKTLNSLNDIYNKAKEASGNVHEKLRDLASGMNAIANINSDGLKSATAAMRGFLKLDFGSMSAIPAGVADNIVSIADGVNLFAMQIDGKELNKAMSALKKLREFDFQGLSMNVDNLDPSIAQKVRAFMDSFKSVSGDSTVSDTLASMQSLFQIDFSGFANFMAEASKGMPNFASAIQQFAAACATPEFDSAIEKLQRLANVDLGSLAQLSSAGYKVVPDVSEQVEEEVVETQASMNKLKAILMIDVSNQFSFIKTRFSELGTIGKSVLGFVGNGFKNLGNRIKKSNSFLSKFTRSLGRIAFYRSVRFLFSQIAKGFKEGTDNLYQYSKAIDGKFAKSMDMISTSMLYFRNSVAAAAAPIINYLAPALDVLIDKAVEVLNYFNELTAKLTGASTWTKALKYPKEYAKATKDASKALKDFQMGFDELNVISDTGSSSADDALDYSKMFTEMKVDVDFEPWADAFRKAIEESDFYGAGQILGNKLKETFANLPSDEWGSALAEKINNAIDLSNGFFSTHPFDEMGTSIAGFLNHALGDLNWHGLAETFSNGLNSILTGIDSFLVEFEAYDVGKKIGEGLSGFDLEETLSNSGHVIHDFLDDVLDAVNGFLEGTEWDKLGGDLFKGLSDFIFGNDWGETGGKAVDVIKNLGIAIKDFVSGIGGEIVLNLFDDEQLDTWVVGAEEITSHIDNIKSSYQDFKDVVKEKGGIFKFFEGWGEYVYDEFHKGSDGAADFAKEANATFDGVTIDAELWQESFNETMDKYVDNWKTGANDMKSSLSNLSSNFQSKFETIKTTVADKLTNAKSALTTKMTEMKTAVSYNVGEMKDSWIAGFNDIKSKATTKLDELKKSFSEWDGLEKFKDHWSDAKRIVADKVVEMKNSIADTIGNIPAAIRGKANGIWEAIEQLINGMIEGFNHFADNISEKFSFTIPNIPGVAGAGQSFGLTIPHIPPVSLGRFENGGFPNIGELFLANENGVAEMIGRIGNRTAVANNDQIVEAVAQGVAKAVAEVLGNRSDNSNQNINIYLDGKQITASVEKYQRTRGVSIYGGGFVNA